MLIRIKKNLLENLDIREKYNEYVINYLIDLKSLNLYEISFTLLKKIFPSKIRDLDFINSINKFIFDLTRDYSLEIQKKYNISDSALSKKLSKKFLGLTPNQFKGLERLAKEVAESGFSNNFFYHFLINDHEFSEYSNQFKNLELWKSENKIILEKYKKLIKEIFDYAQSIDLEPILDGAWFHIIVHKAKKSKGLSKKRYLTFAKGRDLRKLFENTSKVKDLLKHLKDLPVQDYLQIKICQHFENAIEHVDNLVIHFKNENDAKLVEEAITKAGFESINRSIINTGRTDWGLDTPIVNDSGELENTSDSFALANDMAQFFKKQYPEKDEMIKAILNKKTDYQNYILYLEKFLNEIKRMVLERKEKTTIKI